MTDASGVTRRQFIKYFLMVGVGVFLAPIIPYIYTGKEFNALAEDVQPLIKNPIPSTGEMLTVIGMGTWITYNVGKNVEQRDIRTDILRVFFEKGGGMIDSSPMYGSSEEVLGYSLGRLGVQPGLFSASKIWHLLGPKGRVQFENSQRLWGLKTFDLFQVHNLLSWEHHLETLRELKEKGIIRYIGITTSHGRRHNELIKIMQSQPIDFIQATYNIADRQLEDQILPLALEKRIAVIANRPYKGGALMDYYKKKPLPEWAYEANCSNWAQFFLKFIVSHPAVTCAIPATSKVKHMEENMSAAYGSLPDENLRNKMISYINTL